ncbi:hypothetical protein [Neosynechococcus sphagnicola]|uniref:hypothetical protein n=1 Tax=Neosynechococcus sphagnicola TaxID=1501145 RepID=UPI0012E00685|nr:hypothetical protein [Neosynechococcus sphagnicola]
MTISVALAFFNPCHRITLPLRDSLRPSESSKQNYDWLARRCSCSQVRSQVICTVERSDSDHPGVAHLGQLTVLD